MELQLAEEKGAEREIELISAGKEVDSGEEGEVHTVEAFLLVESIQVSSSGPNSIVSTWRWQRPSSAQVILLGDSAQLFITKQVLCMVKTSPIWHVFFFFRNNI